MTRSIHTPQGLITTRRPVGSGSTAMNILAPLLYPDCTCALLLVPPILIEETIRTYESMMEWRVPTITVHKTRGETYSRVFASSGQTPHLHVVSYTKLAQPDAGMLLDAIRPDLIIADEGSHIFKHRESVKTARLLRYLHENPYCRHVIWVDDLDDIQYPDLSSSNKKATKTT